MKIEVASATFREATGFGSYASFATCCVFQGLYLAEGSYGFEDIMRRCSGDPCMLAAMHAVAPGPKPTFVTGAADDRSQPTAVSSLVANQAGWHTHIGRIPGFCYGRRIHFQDPTKQTSIGHLSAPLRF